jgi:hypothetical protein
MKPWLDALVVISFFTALAIMPWWLWTELRFAYRERKGERLTIHDLRKARARATRLSFSCIFFFALSAVLNQNEVEKDWLNQLIVSLLMLVGCPTSLLVFHLAVYRWVYPEARFVPDER